MRSTSRSVAATIGGVLLCACEATEPQAEERSNSRTPSSSAQGAADDQPPRKPQQVVAPPPVIDKATYDGKGDVITSATATEDDAETVDESTATVTSTAADTATGTGSSDTTTSTGTDVDADSEIIDRAEVEADDTLTYDDFAKDFLDTWCVACHGAQHGSVSGIRLDVYADAGGMQGVYTTREALADRIAFNTMPPGGSMPTLEDRLAFLAWVEAGAQEADPIDPGNAANSAPTIAFAGAFATATTAGFVDASGGSVQITYTASDVDGDPVALKIERSSNGGATYGTLIVNGHTQPSSYTWSTPTAGDLVDERIRITADDGKGGVSTVESPVYVMSTNAYTYDGSIGSLLTAQCGCHPNGQPAATPYDPGSYASVFSNRSLVATKSVDGSMGSLSTAQKSQLLVWIKRGAPQ